MNLTHKRRTQTFSFIPHPLLIFTNKLRRIHLTTSLIMVLSQEDIDGCRQAFLAFDKDRSGTIDVWELRQVLVRRKSM